MLKEGLKRGDSGAAVKALQTVINKTGLTILNVDGIFGPATEAALMKFGVGKVLTAEAIKLIEGSVIKVKPQPYPNWLDTMLTIAFGEMKAGAREIGGNNMGPWVRKYMDGNEGKEWPWCAGFSLWCVKQAALPFKPPIKEKYSSGRIGKEAKSKGWLTKDIKKVYPGCLFLVEDPDKNPSLYQHTGIVAEVGPDYIVTIEGNSRIPGEIGGDKVCSKHRGIKNLTFVLLPKVLA